MKILVTVGSGRFDQLIQAVDEQLGNDKYRVTCQIAVGGHQPNNHPFSEFFDDFQSQWQDADMVICHGGAATVFELLEAGKKLVVVPNQIRIDGHQKDLADYVEQQHYAVICRDLSQLAQSVERCMVQDFKPYHKEAFFMADDILQYFEVSR